MREEKIKIKKDLDHSMSHGYLHSCSRDGTDLIGQKQALSGEMTGRLESQGHVLLVPCPVALLPHAGSWQRRQLY